MKASITGLIQKQSHCDYCKKQSIEAIVLQVGEGTKTIGCDCAARLLRVDAPLMDRTRPRTYWRKTALVADFQPCFARRVEIEEGSVAA